MAAVTVEVLKDYRDKEKSMIFHKGERHEVTQTRADKLAAAGVAGIIEPEPGKKEEKKNTAVKKHTG